MPDPIRTDRTVIGTPRRSTDVERLPGIWNPGQPRYSAVMLAMKNLALRTMPNFPAGNVLELPAGATLNDAKARLNSLGIADLSTVGSISLTSHLVVDRPGLIAPKRLFEGVARVPRGTNRKLAPQPLSLVPQPGAQLYFAPMPRWPQTESVIIADELDLRDKTITIMRDKVLHLWIIARRIKASTGAVIIYSPLENPGLGVAGVAGSPNPGNPNYNRYERQSSSGHYAHDGGNGNQGGNGGTGPGGYCAPDLTVCALEIDAMPEINLQGQKGGSGGSGGRGANGGDGQRGRDSEVETVLGVPVNCAHGPGFGGNGGRGGDGGKGGRGGNGGNGATVTIATLEGTITPLVTAHPFAVNIAGGNGGNGGSQGAPGSGGLGGMYGHRTGWPCNDEPTRWGSDGSAGQRTGDLGPGDVGSITGKLAYEIITQAEWDLLFERPWVLSLEPVVVFAGDPMVVHGTHFVNGSKVVVDGRQLAANFNYADQLTFNAPQDLIGGEHVLSVLTPDGRTSNQVPFRVRPYLMEIQRGGAATNTVSAGDVISLVGRSFVSGAGVYINGESVPTTSFTPTSISLQLAQVIGEDAGGSMKFVVHNPDVLESNEVSVEKLPSLDSGFRAGVNGYAFKNFSHGKPDWGTFRATFGTGEVTSNAILHPFLTGAFYLFYEWFLSGGGAHCSGFAATSLKKFHQGVTNQFSQGPASTDDPPPITNALMGELDAAQGRVLSDELITHYADQGQEGIDRVERTIREIEQAFRDRAGENSSRVVCFIPAGNIWDAFSDSDYRNAFMNAHCLVPTRITYPDAGRSLNGAKLYVYDSNEVGMDNKCLDLFEQGGKIHFNYTGGGSNFSSTTGFTLGTATLKKQLLDDVDMPFSLSFFVDLILSPAQIRVEDGAGKMLGFKDGKMHSDVALGYVCPWLENLLLVRAELAVTRRIIGRESGTYTYATIAPRGKSLVIKDASCSPNSEEIISINQDFSQVSITCNEPKSLDIHIGEKLESGEVRYLNLRHAIGVNEKTMIEMNPAMDGVKIITPNRAVDVSVQTIIFDGDNITQERTIQINIPSGKKLELPQGLWHDLTGYGPVMK
jgi:hypothetical protein